MRGMTERVSVTLPSKIKKIIRSKAKESGMSVSTYCANLIQSSM